MSTSWGGKIHDPYLAHYVSKLEAVKEAAERVVKWAELNEPQGIMFYTVEKELIDELAKLLEEGK